MALFYPKNCPDLRTYLNAVMDARNEVLRHGTVVPDVEFPKETSYKDVEKIIETHIKEEDRQYILDFISMPKNKTYLYHSLLASPRTIKCPKCKQLFKLGDTVRERHVPCVPVWVYHTECYPKERKKYVW